MYNVAHEVIAMSIEDQLRQLIVEKYGSVRAFTKVIGVPYSTIDSMLKRGLNGTGVATVLLVCLTLQIDIEELLEGRVSPKHTSAAEATPVEKQSETDVLRSTLLHNFDQLNQEGQERLVETSDDMVSSGKYIKSDPAGLGKEA